jgi:hypothetical protein
LAEPLSIRKYLEPEQILPCLKRHPPYFLKAILPLIFMGFSGILSNNFNSKRRANNHGSSKKGSD